MNAYALTAIVCFGICALISGILIVAWCYDRAQRHEPLISPELRRLLLINTLQIVACCLFGLAIAWIYYRGWCATWRP